MTADRRKLSPKQEQLVTRWLSTRLTPFRRSDVADALVRSIRPRDPRRATALADVAIRALVTSGLVTRQGRMHYRRVTRARTLRDGTRIPEGELATLDIRTRVPSKRVSVDLETGQLYRGTASGWDRADSASAL